METVVSGIRSTGNLHIGNYFGALKNFVKIEFLSQKLMLTCGQFDENEP